MTVLGFLVIALVFSLGKMYLFSSTPEWRANHKSHTFHQEHESYELDEGTIARHHEWVPASK